MLVWNHRIDNIFSIDSSKISGAWTGSNVPFKMFKAVSGVGVPVHMPYII